MQLKKLLMVCGALLCPCTLMADEVNFHNDDAALISHIKHTDYIFTTALSQCESEQIVRDGNNFEFTAVCRARAAIESDCPEYKIDAKGTVDTDSWATVRKIKLELQCHG